MADYVARPDGVDAAGSEQLRRRRACWRPRTAYPPVKTYTARTDRELPVVILEPR